MVKLGVIPFPVAMLGVIVPFRSKTPAPLLAVPMPKWVAVPLPPVPAGKLIVDVGLTLLPVTVHPPLVRATATRA